MSQTQTFERLESEVRGYIRSFPTVFDKAQGSLLFDKRGHTYMDFLSGASVLNYGHNNPVLKAALVDYLESDGIVHSLDMATRAKEEFLNTFEREILKPRGMEYKMQFPGPTGTNAVEAAFKLARRVKQRTNIIAFTNGFHGVSLGSLAATGNSKFRDWAGITPAGTDFLPYDGYLGDSVDTTEYLDTVLTDPSSGIDLPAAVIVETVQGEGGVNTASYEWLRSLERVCRRHDVLLIVDDIQVGCGRTGTFFSFENAGISPDIITLSKSLSGFGLPMSLVLMKPGIDAWTPGAHSGTFRGHNLAFVTATAAIKEYWTNRKLQDEVLQKELIARSRLESIVENYPQGCFSVRGRGMIYGLVTAYPELTARITKEAFNGGLVIETSGSRNEVIKILPPVVIEKELFASGLHILDRSIAKALGSTFGYSEEVMAGKAK
jgi:diaminobutyrate-2-oxoglutarate transaminase